MLSEKENPHRGDHHDDCDDLDGLNSDDDEGRWQFFVVVLTTLPFSFMLVVELKTH